MKEQKYIASFVKRGERPLSPRRQELVDTLLPKIQPSIEEINHSKREGLWLEIGFGAGEHLAGQAEANPNALIIGCETFRSGIANLLSQIDEKKLDNIRIFTNDARLLLESLPDNSLDRIFILFPDPWPKKKHHKRRLINGNFLDLLETKLKPGAKLRFATDHMGYLRWTLEYLQNRENFHWNAEKSSDWTLPPEDHFRTRYEEKNKTGDNPVFLNYTYKL